MSIPIDSCQSVQTYDISFKYVCNDGEIYKNIWWNSAKCHDDNYIEMSIDSDQFVDYHCISNVVTTSTVIIDYYKATDSELNTVIQSKEIIINECFPINTTCSFQYECVNNYTLHKLVYNS